MFDKARDKTGYFKGKGGKRGKADLLSRENNKYNFGYH